MTSTTTGLSNVMSTFYDKVFLDRAMNEMRYDYGAQRRSFPRNSGKTVVFNRFSQLALATTALTEGVNPSAVDMTSTQVSATIAEYGSYTQVSSLFELTSLDENLKEHVEVLGQNAGETLDSLIATELSANGTAQLAGAKSNITDVAATDVLSGAEIRKAVRTLKNNKGKRFEEGLFRGIIDPSQAYDLFGNTEWLNSRIYTNTDDMKRGVIGDLHGVRFVESNLGSTQASTVTVHHAFICAKNGYGIVSLEGQPGPRILVKTPGPNDVGNPLDLMSTVGWRANFCAKVLNANWVIVVKTGVTA